MFKITRSTPFIKDALGPRRLSKIWKIWYVLICLSMESDLRTLWAQWLSPKHPQRLCKVCWSTVLLLKDLVIAMSMNEHLSGKTKFSMASCCCIFSLQGREVILRYMRKGTLMNNYAHIFAIMMRLRQLCCHRELLPINWAGIDMNDLVGWAQRQIQQQGPPGTSLEIYTHYGF